MRPKRRVAVLDGNEISRRIRCFTLTVWGYNAIGFATAGELMHVIEHGRFDGVIAMLPGPAERAVLLRAQALEGRVLSFDVSAGAPWSVANVSLASTTTPLKVRETLRILMRHKPGPKKHARREAEAVR